MITPRRARFAPRVPCAVEPRAFGMFFDAPPPPVVEMRGDVAVVDVRGPLVHHEDPFFDSYDAIKGRIVEALSGETKPRAIVLSLDSPGGMVSGCFDTADEIKARCAAAGVPLYTYVDGQAASAAYALACAGSSIVVPPTGMVGSIGCIAELVDVSAMNAAHGISIELVTSGARKADGNPNRPIEDASVAAVRAQVMQLAELFFEHVAANRPMQVDEVRALEAGIVIGASATPTLADHVMGLDEMIAAIAAGTMTAPAGAEGNDDMSTKNGAGAVRATKSEDDEAYEAAVATLRQAAAKGNAKAKKMLQAELADDAPAPCEPDDAPKNDASAPAAAPAAECPPADHKEPDEDDKGAKALAAVAKLDAKIEVRDLLAGRPDISPELRASLSKLSPEAVSSVLAATPVKPVAKLGAAAAGAVVSATRGEGQGDAPPPATSLVPSVKDQIDQAMGISGARRAPTFSSQGARHVASYPAMTREERITWLAERAAAKAAAAKSKTA